MQTVLKEKVNVGAVFRSYKDDHASSRSGWEHKRIEPRYLKRKKGEVFKNSESASFLRPAQGQAPAGPFCDSL